VARELRIGSPIRTQPGDRRVVALVGPTGVGKTTTVAKLAAGFRIEARRRVGLLTIDTFRIAAVQQLKAYAEIMDLPMEVVEKPDEMQPALERLGDVDLVLIDTAGRSPRSDARIDQLVELLRTAQPDETHLVLSSTSSASTIQLALKGFAPVRPTAAILTKLDEAPQTASILSAIVAADDFVGVPISYTTNGQQVPDDISTADAQSLLSRLLPAKVMVPQMEAA
jgi:flagellar biosynthesis protein FlhF